MKSLDRFVNFNYSFSDPKLRNDFKETFKEKVSMLISSALDPFDENEGYNPSARSVLLDAFLQTPVPAGVQKNSPTPVFPKEEKPVSIAEGETAVGIPAIPFPFPPLKKKESDED